MKPEEAGNCVLLGRTYIPAVNIQVEGVPGMIKVADDIEPAWYGVYFEILFEDAALWIIMQGSESKDNKTWDQIIHVAEYPNWGKGEGFKQLGVERKLESWEDFLSLYLEKRSTLGKAC